MPSPSKAAWRKGSPKLARIELVTRIDVLASGPVKFQQLDGAVATLDALPAVVRAVNRRMPVLLDGGVRRGSDVFKAIALGAAGVLVGLHLVWRGSRRRRRRTAGAGYPA